MNNSSVKTLNVLYQSDDNYAMVTGVSIASLLENNKHLGVINIYLLDDGISSVNLEKLNQLCESYGRVLNIVDTHNIRAMLQELKVEPWRGTYTTYFKLFAVNELDLPTDLLLQIDGDTIINGPLDELTEYDMGDCICAATIDSVLAGYKSLLSIGADEPYYNCGVMLINKANWTNNRCRERIIDHLKNKRSRYFVVDQDIINVLFRHEIKPLDLTYNFNSGLYIYGIDNTFRIYDLTERTYIPKNHIHEVMQGPLINHCMGAQTGRPWEKDSIHPQNELFDKYLALTPWTSKDKIVVNRAFIFKAQRFAYEHLPMSVYWRLHRAALTWYMKKRNKECIQGK